jgi:hypothetical protein
MNWGRYINLNQRSTVLKWKTTTNAAQDDDNHNATQDDDKLKNKKKIYVDI